MKKFLTGRLFRGVLAAVLGLCIFAGGMMLAAPASAGSTREDVADNRTLNTWDTQYFAQSTRNIGRIWTDKSVSEDFIALRYGQLADQTVNKTEGSDFIVALSAMSSTSSLTTHVAAPLDVVMVLDTSGSMSETLYSYTPVYSLSTRSSYYVQTASGSWEEVGYSDGGLMLSAGWYYGSIWDYTQVIPKTSAEDDTAGRVQFYTRSGSGSKLAALKTAATNFVNATAALNAEISDASQQHRIALVRFASASNTEILSGLDDFNAATLNRTVNNLSANGQTRAASGLSQANDAFRDARAGAQKVVVFFTDGEPNQGNGFWPSEAAQAVSTAKTMKDAGTIIYSVGVWSGADVSDLPANTNQAITSEHFNAYLHGVSSNFPNATATYRGGNSSSSTWSLTLGDKVPESDYYKVASDAIELENIFNEIFQAITTLPAAPTTTDSSRPQSSGYVTFTDKLGQFMEVKGANAIVYDDNLYTVHNVRTGVDGTTIYEFTQSVTDVNQAYPGSYSLTNLLIRVTPGATAADGDSVAVMIPAALLPLMHYDIADDGTLTIAEEHPVRVLYSVGLKDGVDQAMKDGTTDAIQGLTQYVRQNSKDGKISFYSNEWSDPQKGGTVVSFVPAATNQFYYFTEDAPLYTDDACTRPLTSTPVHGATYWYKHTYYSNELGNPDNTQVTTSIAVAHEDYMTPYLEVNEDGVWYAPAGIRRSSMSNDPAMQVVKPDKNGENVGGSEAANVTGTAAYALLPTWGSGGIQNYLGNNGRIQYTTTGSLAITKLVTADEGLTAPADAEFTFQVKLTRADTNFEGTYATALTRVGSADACVGSIMISDNGTGTVKLKAGETLTIYGLPTGTTYEVTETDIPAGFTQTAVSGEADKTILIADTKTETFTNHYAVEPVKVDTHFPIKKVVVDENGDAVDWTGKDWSFRFTLSGITPGAPMPDNRTITITKASQEQCFGFENVEFSKPGTYTYTATEIKPTTEESRLAGIHYSSAIYRLEIIVTDNGDGTLSIDRKLLLVVDDKNVTQPEGTTAENVVFTNLYQLSSIKAGPVAHKKLVDLSGGRSLKANEFYFRITALTDGAPTFSPDVVTNTQSGVVNFGTTEFIQEDVGNTYIYKLEELPGNEPGMTYASEYYTIEISVISVKNANGEDAVSYHATHYDKDGKQISAVDASGNPVVGFMPFTNTYKAAAGTLALDVRKTLLGRDWTDSDGFGFTLTAVDGAPMPQSDVAILSKPAAGNVASGSFGLIQFTKVGTYKYQISENVPADAKGITYDSHVADVTVTVEDLDGQLTASAVYSNITAAFAEDKAVTTAAAFTNTYQAAEVQMTPSQLLVSKTLVGREWKSSDEFHFSIWPDGTRRAIPAPAFHEQSIEWSTRDSTMAFDEENLVYNDAGTYDYYITENPGTIAGITYDRTIYRVRVVITDDGQGKLKVDSVTYATGTLPENAVMHLTVMKDLQYTDTDLTAAAFTNIYGADTVTLTGDTAIYGYKTLAGRDSLAGESFTFGLMRMDDKPGVTMTGAIATVSGLENETAKKFTFGDVTFSQPGIYQFAISEDIPAQKAENLTYDGHVCTVTVEVTDNLDGQLTAKTTYSDGYYASFTNLYYDVNDAKEVSSGTNYIDNELVSAGQTLTYTIDWANTTGADATIEIIDTIPAGTSFVSATDDGVYADGAVTWSFQAAPSKYGTVTLKVKVDDDLTGGAEISNTASVNGFKTNATLNFVPGKSVDSKAAELGAVKTYTIRFGNPTGEDAKVIITDVLDENLTFISADNGGKYDEETRTITWTVEPVKAWMKDSVSFKAKLNVKALDSSTENSAVILLGDHKATTNVVTIPKITTSDLTITKAVELTPDQGTQIDTTLPFTFKVELMDAAGDKLTGEFAYTVGDAGDSIESGGTITLTHGQSAVISGLPAGTTYTVTEIDIPAGYTPRENQISRAILSADKVEFVNTYSVESLTKAVLEASKALTGPDGTTLSADQFSFSVYTDEGCTGTPVATGTNDSQGNVVFSAQTFNAVGEYTFYIKEDQDPAAVHVDYDDRIFKATVVIADNGDGTLKADSVNYALADGTAITGAPRFENKFKDDYTVGSFTVEANKILTGRDLEAGEFLFGLYDADGNLIATGTNEAAADGESADVTFANVSYALRTVRKELPETYPVTVSVENAPAAFIRLSDTAVILTEEELALVMDGQMLELKVLVAGSELADGDKALLPADAALVQGLTISGTKLVADVETPAQLGEAMKLTLAVEDAENRVFALARFENGAVTILEDLDGNNNGTLTVNDGGFGTYAIIYTQQELPTEETPAEEAPVEEAPIEETPAEEAPVQEAPIQEEPKAAALTGSRFRRTRDVKAESEIVIPEDWNGEYTFTIRELDSPKLPGVTYATEEYQVKVTIYKDGENLVASKPVYSDSTGTVSADQVIFRNSYAPAESGTVALAASKVLTNRELKANEFTFEVYEGETLITTGTNDAQGKISFQLPSFTATGEHTYTIREKAGNDSTVIYSQESYQVTVTVTDDTKAGKLVAEVKYPEGGVSFTNRYKTPVDIYLQAGKELTGRQLQDQEFTFQIAMNGEVVGTAKNDASGTITFAPITFRQEGTYELVISEVAGSEIGVTYDRTEHTVKVTVAPGQTGALEAKLEGNAGITFRNVYTKPTPAQIRLEAEKTLSGRKLTDGEFTFQISCGGQVLSTGNNNAGGKVVFDDITFDAVGVYELTVAELAGNAERVTYDTTVYTVTVTVTLQEDNTLLAQYQLPETGLTFHNTYTPPPGTPDTGDGSNTIWLAMLAMISAAGAAALLLLNRKKRARA